MGFIKMLPYMYIIYFEIMFVSISSPIYSLSYSCQSLPLSNRHNSFECDWTLLDPVVLDLRTKDVGHIRSFSVT